MRESNYPIASKGLATSFTESEIRKEYAAQLQNLHINSAGGAELRRGVTQLGATVKGTPFMTNGHELVTKAGLIVLFVSGGGKIFAYNETTATYGNAVFAFADLTGRVQSVNMGNKVIFYNGVDRPVYSEDGSTFYELRPLMEFGSLATGSSATAVRDSTIVNWVANTQVTTGDLVYNVDLNAYAYITQVATAEVTHSPISSSATGLGLAASSQVAGQRYQILDLVSLDIIPASDPQILDNVALAAGGGYTFDTSIVVSGAFTSAMRDPTITHHGFLNFAATEIEIGDYIYNATRNAITQVRSFSGFSTDSASLISCVAVSGQTGDDSLVFLKSAIPIPRKAHVHFGRLYLVDDRNPTKIYYSSANDPTDWSTDAGTIQLSDVQPEGETIKSMATFQRFLAIGGSRTVYFFEGTDPTTTGFTPLGSLPQGLVSQYGMTAIGNELVFMTVDGVQSSSLVRFATQFGRIPLSNAINKTLRELIQANGEESLTLTHYPHRSWVLAKVGSELFVYNYSPNISPQGNVQNADDPTAVPGSWSQFSGEFANQEFFFVRNNGDLICGGTGGVIGLFDQAGVYDDYGDAIDWIYQTGWLTTTDPKVSVKQKHGVYIKPLVQVGAQVTGTIRAESPFERTSTDVVTFTAGAGVSPIGTFIVGTSKVGGSGVANIKYPLRWKGERVRLTFSGSTSVGPLILGTYTIYSNEWGKL